MEGHTEREPFSGAASGRGAAPASATMAPLAAPPLDKDEPGPSEPGASCPQKARNQERKRRNEGRGRRPRKGEAKRARRDKALRQAEQRCHYFTDNAGLRRVKPYVYDFQTHAKERWLGRKVIDVFSAEFGGNPRSYYERAIRCGLLKVNGNTITLDYELKSNDVVCNRTHRHEPPVAGGDIKILCETDDAIVVDKPCTVPIHPCGSYRFNTLFYILQRQRPDLSLRVCHRLDRLTSGLTIFAKTAERAGVIQKQIGAGETRKTYLARVMGNFGECFPPARRRPGSPATFAAAMIAADAAAETTTAARLKNALGGDKSPRGNDVSGDPYPSAQSHAAGREEAAKADPNGLGSSTEADPGYEAVALPEAVATAAESAHQLWWAFEASGEGGLLHHRTENANTADGGKQANGLDNGGEKAKVVIRVNCPIRVLDAKDGVYECHEEGKEAQTVVRTLAYDAASDTSVLECTPVHGRTHQIRLHLQWVGHPIANDPCYGGQLHFGNPEMQRRIRENPSANGWKGSRHARLAAAAAAAAAGSARADVGAGAESPAGAVPLLVQQDSVVEEGQQRLNAAADASGVVGVEEGGTQDDTKRTGSHGRLDTSGITSKDVEEQREGEDDEAFMIRTCPLCQDGERFTENQLHCLGIWLHALRYQGPDWEFETSMPSWATL